MVRRLLSIWFPRLASEISLRAHPLDGPFALIHRAGQADHLHCLNALAEMRGLRRGMALADARAICPDITTRQIIMVAHNANLVINTDADQIIVAEVGLHQIGGGAYHLQGGRLGKRRYPQSGMRYSRRR
jgi:hypothetical protein